MMQVCAQLLTFEFKDPVKLQAIRRCTFVFFARAETYDLGALHFVQGSQVSGDSAIIAYR